MFTKEMSNLISLVKLKISFKKYIFVACNREVW